MRPALSWLVSSVGRALHGYHRGQGFESRTSLLAEVSHVRDLLPGKSRTSLFFFFFFFFFFSGFLFANVTTTQCNFIVQLMHYNGNCKFNSMSALIHFSDTFHLVVPKHFLRNCLNCISLRRSYLHYIFYSRSYAPEI